MNLPKEIIKKTKYYFKQKAIVLSYHRIDDVPIDPWQLAVTKENFEEQLKILRRKYKVISVEELINQLQNQSVSNKTICITFDDGYRDNFYNAMPLLEKYQCPATFYIPTKYVGKEMEYWSDELLHLIVETQKLPLTLSFYIRDELFEFHLGKDSELKKTHLEKHKAWIWFQTPPPSKRCELYLELWKRIRPLPFDEIQAILFQLKTWIGQPYRPHEDGFPITENQLKEIPSSLFTVGIHTVSHPALACHSYGVQRKEVEECKKYLESELGNRVTSIAYPYGNYNDITIKISEELNLNAGFTTHENAVYKDSSHFELGRFQVKNWNGDKFQESLNRWIKGFRF